MKNIIFVPAFFVWLFNSGCSQNRTAVIELNDNERME